MRRIMLAAVALALSAAAPAFAGTITCGTDHTANTTAINNALSAGGTTTLAAGTCYINGPIVMPTSTATLIGTYSGTTNQSILEADAASPTYDMITMGQPIASNTYSGLHVKHLIIDAQWTTSASGISKEGRGIVIEGEAQGTSTLPIEVNNVEVRNAVDGVSNAGTWVKIANSTIHDIRHAGVFSQGNGGLSSPENVATNVTVMNNTLWNLAQDDVAGKTYDGILISSGTNYTTVYNNTVGQSGVNDSGTDINASDNETGCLTPASNVTIYNNLVQYANGASGGANIAVGIRLYGCVQGVSVYGNTMTEDKTGFKIVGQVSNVTFDDGGVSTPNTISGPNYTVTAIDIEPLSGASAGTNITIDDANSLNQTNHSKSLVTVNTATNVNVTGNYLNGGSIDSSGAGSGGTFSPNM